MRHIDIFARVRANKTTIAMYENKQSPQMTNNVMAIPTFSVWYVSLYRRVEKKFTK